MTDAVEPDGRPGTGGPAFHGPDGPDGPDVPEAPADGPGVGPGFPAPGRPATFKQRAAAGHDRRPFHKGRALPWTVGGGLTLIALIVVPLVRPGWSPVAERVSTAVALFFLLAAVARALRMRDRAPWIALALTMVLYAATAWTPLIGYHDIFVLTVLVGFGVFVLAGFNLLFVLEEVVYDIHRFLHLRGRFWKAIPFLLGIALVPLVYIGEPFIGTPLGTLQLVLPFGVFLMLVGWLIRWRIHPGGEAQLREITLLVVGAVAGAGLADVVGLLRSTTGIIPSLVAYLVLILTWTYVSYTTLQRAQYILRSNDVFTWIALVFASSFAVLAHVHSLYDAAGKGALTGVVDLRVGYLIFGVWLGLTFFVLRGLWRIFEFLRDEKGLGRFVRRTAGRLARVTEELIRTEDRLEDATTRVFEGVDRLLPGHDQERPSRTRRRPPRRLR